MEMAWKWHGNEMEFHGGFLARTLDLRCYVLINQWPHSYSQGYEMALIL